MLKLRAVIQCIYCRNHLVLCFRITVSIFVGSVGWDYLQDCSLLLCSSHFVAGRDIKTLIDLPIPTQNYIVCIVYIYIYIYICSVLNML